jgi:hypothetical protein
MIFALRSFAVAVFTAFAVSTPAIALDITTWNLQHMMSPTTFDEWAAFCSKYSWREDFVKAAGVIKPKRLTYCNAHDGFLFPTKIEESRPLHTREAFAEKTEALVKRRAELNSDIFALQEVGDEAAVKSIFPAAQWDVVATKADISQNIAFAVRRDSGVKIIQSRQIDDLALRDDAGHQVRPGLELTVQYNGKRLVMLNIHLKAACRGQPISAPSRPGYADGKRWREIQQGCQVMRNQVPVLEAWIEKQARAESLFMILGDWNRDLKRDLQMQARLFTDESPHQPITEATQIGSMIKEISDGEPQGAWVAVIIPKIKAGNKPVQSPDQKSKEKTCHLGIDNFALSDSLMTLLGVDRKALKATGTDYGAEAYAVDKAMPSDHCPVTLKLETF